MKQHLAISIIGTDRAELAHELTKAIADCGGSIAECRTTSLGGEFAMIALVAGNWHAVARIETELKRIADTGGLALQVRRTDLREPRANLAPYSVDVVCLDQAGIVAALTGFFASRGIEIGELSTRSYAAPHTGAPMCSVYVVANIPSRIHIGALREEFMDFCDHHNLDAILEPVKG